MKKNTLLYSGTCLTIITALIVSCNKLDENDLYENMPKPNRIGVLHAQLNISATGGEVSSPLVVNGESSQWEATTKADWITLSKGTTSEHGKVEETVIMTVDANTYYGRQDTVFLSLPNVLSTKSTNRFIVIKQASALEDPSLRFETNAVNFTAAAEELSLDFISNQNQIQATTSSTWIQASVVNNKLKIFAAENNNQEPRTGIIRVVAGQAPHTAVVNLTVNQAKADDENNITIDGIELIKVKAGSFNMGAQSIDPTKPNYYLGAAANQSPVHRVTITKDYYIGKFEVTQQQYESIMRNNPSSTKRINNPVEMVDHTLALEFARKLSQKTGKIFRLPTEAEWEYAARGGHQPQNTMYSGSNDVKEVAYHFLNPGDQRDKAITLPVGSYMPNSLGVYDMSGNVYEWCSDFFQNYSGADRTDPKGTGTNPIMRGGSWYHNAASQTVYYRGNNVTSFSRAYLGFRIVYQP